MEDRGLLHGVRQVLPDVFGHVAQDRSDQSGQAFDDQGHHGLAAASALVLGSAHIEPVLGDVEVEVRQIGDAEVLQQLEEAEELEAFEGFCDVVHHLGRALQHPAVQQWQFRNGDRVGCRIEVVQVAQQIAAGVAHLAVHISQLAQNPGPDRHIGGVIHRAHPEPQHIGAVGRFLFLVLAPLDDHHRVDHIAEGFAHLSALLIQGEAMGEHPLVGGVAIHGDRGEQ